MYAIVGLGNPGIQYEQTRHNVGFWVLELLAKKFAEGAFWKVQSGCKYHSLKIFNKDTLLIMPQKFMNLSGEAIQPLISFYKIPLTNLLVVQDDLDLKVGELRFREGGSSGGHRGVEDIIQKLGNNNFLRVKVGIGHPKDLEETARIDVKSWVLQRPFTEEMIKLKEASQRAADGLELFLAEGLKTVQQKYHTKTL